MSRIVKIIMCIRVMWNTEKAWVEGKICPSKFL